MFPLEALAVGLIKHEVVPKCGSFEVRFPDSKSVYFYWDDELGRRRPEQIGSKEARAGTSVCARRARRPQMRASSSPAIPDLDLHGARLPTLRPVSMLGCRGSKISEREDWTAKSLSSVNGSICMLGSIVADACTATVR